MTIKKTTKKTFVFGNVFEFFSFLSIISIY